MSEADAPRGGRAKSDGYHPAYIAYQHVREFVGEFFTKGWRNAFAWGLVVVILAAYAAGLKDRSLDLQPYNDLAWFVALAFVWRGGVEKGALNPLIETFLTRRLGGGASPVAG